MLCQQFNLDNCQKVILNFNLKNAYQFLSAGLSIQGILLKKNMSSPERAFFFLNKIP